MSSAASRATSPWPRRTAACCPSWPPTPCASRSSWPSLRSRSGRSACSSESGPAGTPADGRAAPSVAHDDRRMPAGPDLLGVRGGLRPRREAAGAHAVEHAPAVVGTPDIGLESGLRELPLQRERARLLGEGPDLDREDAGVGHGTGRLGRGGDDAEAYRRHPGADEPERDTGCAGDVEHAAVDERAAVVDPDPRGVSRVDVLDVKPG